MTRSMTRIAELEKENEECETCCLTECESDESAKIMTTMTDVAKSDAARFSRQNFWLNECLKSFGADVYDNKDNDADIDKVLLTKDEFVSIFVKEMKRETDFEFADEHRLEDESDDESEDESEDESFHPDQCVKCDCTFNQRKTIFND